MTGMSDQDRAEWAAETERALRHVEGDGRPRDAAPSPAYVAVWMEQVRDLIHIGGEPSAALRERSA